MGTGVGLAEVGIADEAPVDVDVVEGASAAMAMHRRQ